MENTRVEHEYAKKINYHDKSFLYLHSMCNMLPINRPSDPFGETGEGF